MPITNLGLADPHWVRMECRHCTYLGVVSVGNYDLDKNKQVDLYFHRTHVDNAGFCLAKYSDSPEDYTSQKVKEITMAESAELFCAITLARMYGLYSG